MIKNSIWLPIALTLLWVLEAFFLAGQGWPTGSDWTLLGLFFTLPLAAGASLLTWVIYSIFWARHPERSGLAFLLVILGLNAAAWRTGIAVKEHGASQDRETLEAVRRADVLDMKDSELLNASGDPIGVRLQFQIHYPESARRALHQPMTGFAISPMAFQQHAWSELWMAPDLAFLHVSRHVDSLGNGSYAVTDDFAAPFVKASPLRGSNDRCFSWQRGRTPRERVLNSPPRNLVIWIPYASRYRGQTRQAYSLRRFYESELKEGWKECSSAIMSRPATSR